jgi:hypothetical protein
VSRTGSPVRRRTAGVCLSALVSLVLAAPDALATGIGFGCVTRNHLDDCAIAEAQLALEVFDAGAGQVRIELANAGPESVVVTRIALDGSAVTGIAGLVALAGEVAFATVDPAQNFPGGQSVQPAFVADLEAAAVAPPTRNGIGAGEALAAVLVLAPGVDFADFLGALASGELRIGLRAQGFASRGSEGLVNLPPVHAPEPASALLLAAGAVALQLGRRRSRRRAER